MSLPGPVPYEMRRFGSEREAPTKGAMRPYRDRLQMSKALVEKAPVRKGSMQDAALRLTEAALFVGAVLPIVLAIPGFGTLFEGVAPLLGPAIPSASTALAVGWWGALLVVVAGTAGVLVVGLAHWGAKWTHGEMRALTLALMGLVVFSAAYLLARTAPSGASGAAAGGAIVMLTIVGAVYACICVARRESWLFALMASFAVIALASLVLGSLASLLLLWSARAFPGQVVARHPWKRTEVALEPIEAPRGNEPDPAGHLPYRVSMPLPQGLSILKLALVFGAFAPFVLALPWFGIAIFLPLIVLLFPLTIPLVWSAAFIQASFIVLWDPGTYGSAAPSALFVLIALLVLPMVGSVVGARAAAHRRRPWAAVAGAVLLIVTGRPICGTIALWAVGYSWRAFNLSEAEPGTEHAPKEGAPGASSH